MKGLEIRRLTRKLFILGFLLLCLVFANAHRSARAYGLCCSGCDITYQLCEDNCSTQPPGCSDGCDRNYLVCERFCDPSC